MHEAGIFQSMSRKPSEETTAAWVRLNRAHQALLCAIESDLKRGGFPPLSWYDALWELSRADHGALRPVELERQMLLPQYSTSRLIDRLSEAGLVERKRCPVDGRGHFVAITAAGRQLQKKMWDTYAASIERHVGAKLTNRDAAQLCGLLDRLR